MSDSTLGLLIFAAIVIAIYYWISRPVTEKELENQRRLKEHEVEMAELERQRREAAREADIPSGRGKTVRAKTR